MFYIIKFKENSYWNHENNESMAKFWCLYRLITNVRQRRQPGATHAMALSTSPGLGSAISIGLSSPRKVVTRQNSVRFNEVHSSNFHRYVLWLRLRTNGVIVRCSNYWLTKPAFWALTLISVMEHHWSVGQSMTCDRKVRKSLWRFGEFFPRRDLIGRCGRNCGVHHF